MLYISLHLHTALYLYLYQGLIESLKRLTFCLNHYQVQADDILLESLPTDLTDTSDSLSSPQAGAEVTNQRPAGTTFVTVCFV